MEDSGKAADRMYVVAVCVGTPRRIAVGNRELSTGLFKEPVPEAVAVTKRGLAGDSQVVRDSDDLDRAVSAYPIEHYPGWQELIGSDLVPGSFGENLTVSGAHENALRIGDVLRVGDRKGTLLQVSEPRVPCRKLDARHGVRLSSMFLESQRVGCLFRVIEAGKVRAGDELTIVETAPDAPTVAEFLRATLVEYWNADDLGAAARAPGLSAFWLEKIEQKLARIAESTSWIGPRRMRIVERRSGSPGAVRLTIECARALPLPEFHGVRRLQIVARLAPGEARVRSTFEAQARVEPGVRYDVTIPPTSTSGDQARLVAFLGSRSVGDDLLVAAPRFD